jgi:hypothetical protein
MISIALQTHVLVSSGNYTSHADELGVVSDREEADLARGVILKATMEEGTGEASPSEGDLVRTSANLR